MNNFSLSRQWLELFIVLALMLISTIIFWLTDLDITVSAYFFQAENANTWLGKNWQWCQWLFDYAPKFINIIAITSLIIIILSYSQTKLKPFRRIAAYLLWVILLGAGLVVNIVFKDNWGRPRPVHIQNFNGEYAYVPPLKLGHTKDKSFTCGHCSVGFSFFALYFLTRKHKRYYLLLALSMGIMMSLSRLFVGGHFLSDALWSGYIMFLVAWLLYYYWYNRNVVINL